MVKEDVLRYAPELGQDIVARRVYDSSPVLLDQFPQDFPIGREGPDSLGLILSHEATVSFNISTQNGRELALERLC
jgi:hypothetical protein